MRITSLELRNFRNCAHRVLEPAEALTVFVGPNAAGKTNIIEAISIIATGTSFRHPRWEEVVRWQTPEALVSMTAEGEGAHAEVQMRIAADGTRVWQVNGVHRRRTTDAVKFVPIVSFIPDDLLLVKGPADMRRTSIDTLGEQLSASYGALRRDYARVVRQRNALLRDDAGDAELGPWTEQLVALGARLHTHRRGLARRIIDAAAPVYAHLSDGEALTMRLVDRCGVGCDEPGADIDRDEAEVALRRELERRRADERARRVSLAGPHRDDLVFEVGGRDARSYASQGQQRTIALAWKLAEVSVVGEMLRRAPVLLLDDVMSELDESRRAALTDLVQREIQTFVTTTNTGYFDSELLSAALVVEIGGE